MLLKPILTICVHQTPWLLVLSTSFYQILPSGIIGLFFFFYIQLIFPLSQKTITSPNLKKKKKISFVPTSFTHDYPIFLFPLKLNSSENLPVLFSKSSFILIKIHADQNFNLQLHWNLLISQKNFNLPDPMNISQFSYYFTHQQLLMGDRFSPSFQTHSWLLEHTFPWFFCSFNYSFSVAFSDYLSLLL